MNEKEVLQFLTRYKSAFLSEISDAVMKSPDQVEKMLLNLSNTGLVKTVSAGEGLYVLPEISILLPFTKNFYRKRPCKKFKQKFSRSQEQYQKNESFTRRKSNWSF